MGDGPIQAGLGFGGPAVHGGAHRHQAGGALALIPGQAAFGGGDFHLAVAVDQRVARRHRDRHGPGQFRRQDFQPLDDDQGQPAVFDQSVILLERDQMTRRVAGPITPSGLPTS